MKINEPIRDLPVESIEGEIALIIQYQPGKSEAAKILQGALQMVHSFDYVDHSLLSSIDTTLEPVSILNDVQHSSLKLLLARGLRNVPDELIKNPDWKKWLGALLVKGKHKLLEKYDSDRDGIESVINELKPLYESTPTKMIGYEPPSVDEVSVALNQVKAARALLPDSNVTFQTELGDIPIPLVKVDSSVIVSAVVREVSTPSIIPNAMLLIESVVFKDGNKWRVSDGNHSFNVSLLDDNFIADVNAGRRFGKGDVLIVDLERIQRIENNSLKTEYAILKVHRHEEPLQKKLFK
ncbi:MAG: hypothetical protein OEW15_08705 [Nitrospirota bacterium]|nr:hypothetical protein [Nitrospirota bacterium]